MTVSRVPPRISADFIDAPAIQELLERTATPARCDLAAVLKAALKLEGLDPEQVALLLMAADEDEDLIFRAASEVKDRIYGGRVVLFAPIYLSNLCVNNCLYCSFRRDNHALERKQLTQDEIVEQVRILADMGHRRLLVEAGEIPTDAHMDYVLESIATIYGTRTEKGSIRRLNVNVAATTVENYRKLKATGIGTYQLFQETYHPEAYARMHPTGPKADYAYHLTAHDRAMTAGIDDVGLGVLFGLHDYRFEVLAMLLHARHLETAFGVGPHTISVPRFRPADGTGFQPPHPVSDREFKRLVAILRLAVPYTGIILSTREGAELRGELLSLGVSQMSAASATTPGGYRRETETGGQFQTADHRTLDEVVQSICEKGFLPSFCTACYRTGRTGEDFMHLAKPGHIQKLCRPNALATFEEFLTDFGSEAAREVGDRTVVAQLDMIEQPDVRHNTERLLERVRRGERDVYL